MGQDSIKGLPARGGARPVGRRWWWWWSRECEAPSPPGAPRGECGAGQQRRRVVVAVRELPPVLTQQQELGAKRPDTHSHKASLVDAEGAGEGAVSWLSLAKLLYFGKTLFGYPDADGIKK